MLKKVCAIKEWVFPTLGVSRPGQFIAIWYCVTSFYHFLFLNSWWVSKEYHKRGVHKVNDGDSPHHPEEINIDSVHTYRFSFKKRKKKRLQSVDWKWSYFHVHYLVTCQRNTRCLFCRFARIYEIAQAISLWVLTFYTGWESFINANAFRNIYILDNKNPMLTVIWKPDFALDYTYQENPTVLTTEPLIAGPKLLKIKLIWNSKNVDRN